MIKLQLVNSHKLFVHLFFNLGHFENINWGDSGLKLSSLLNSTFFLLVFNSIHQANYAFHKLSLVHRV